MKKALSALLTAALLAGCVSPVFAADSAPTAFTEEENIQPTETPKKSNYYNYYGEIINTGKRSPMLSDKSIVGEIISSDYPGSVESAANAFDLDLSTKWTSKDDTCERWVGLKTDAPARVKSIRIASYGGHPDDDIIGDVIQGSTDGITWENILVISRSIYNSFVESYQLYQTKYINIELANRAPEYSYFRYLAFGSKTFDYGRIAEFHLFTSQRNAFKSPGDSTMYFYNGPLVHTEKWAVVSADNSIPGLVIGGSSTASGFGFEKAFDGDLSTYYKGTGAYNDMWIGIRAPKPTEIRSFAVATPDNNDDGISDGRNTLLGSRFQGSDDGINWEDIYVYDESDIEAYENDTENTYLTITLPTDGKEYRFFRMINPNGVNALAEICLFSKNTEEPDESEPEETEPEIIEPVLGDISGNSSLDIKDAILLFRHIMLPELFSISYTGNMDFNNDGSVDIADAIRLFRHSLMPGLYPLE